MNLEEKANQYLKKVNSSKDSFCITDFTEGYIECKNEIIDFLNANQKACVKDILKHLEELK